MPPHATFASPGQESDPESFRGIRTDDEGLEPQEGTQPAEGDSETPEDERDDIIKKLREEIAAARIKAKRADDLQARLVSAAEYTRDASG